MPRNTKPKTTSGVATKPAARNVISNNHIEVHAAANEILCQAVCELAIAAAANAVAIQKAAEALADARPNVTGIYVSNSSDMDIKDCKVT